MHDYKIATHFSVILKKQILCADGYRVQPTSKMHAAIIIMTTTHVGLNRYTFSAREVLHTYLERAKNRSFPLFQQPLSFSLPFIGSKGYHDSYRGRCPPLTEQSRQSVRRITKARLVDERLSPANVITTITCPSERSHTLSRICTDPHR